MLSIYADTFMTATRINAPKLRQVPRATPSKRKKWSAPDHWKLRFRREIDPNTL